MRAVAAFLWQFREFQTRRHTLERYSDGELGQFGIDRADITRLAFATAERNAERRFRKVPGVEPAVAGGSGRFWSGLPRPTM